eukprot:SAG31_NODE_177_length_21310_cov_8.894064_16_plen_1195_part_00
MQLMAFRGSDRAGSPPRQLRATPVRLTVQSRFLMHGSTAKHLSAPTKPVSFPMNNARYGTPLSTGTRCEHDELVISQSLLVSLSLLLSIKQDSPGPCMATFREYVRDRVVAVAEGPCRLAYNNCVGGQNQGWCTANLRDAIGSLQSEYAREAFERTLCTKSRDFQWLYQCVREQDTSLGVRVDQVSTPWRAATCALPDKLTRVQCLNLVGSGGIAAACPAPVGGWSPASARAYSCSPDCARMLYAAAEQCQTTFAAYVDTWPVADKFSLLMLMAPGPTYTGPCHTTRREQAAAILGRVAADPDCGPKYDVCFSDDVCRTAIREGFQSLGYAPSRTLFESTVCTKPVAYQELHECTSTKLAVFVDDARTTGDWSRSWRRTSCLAPDKIPPLFCSGLLSSLNVTCPPPEDGVFNMAAAQSYACSENCAKTLTTAWNYCQTSFYMRTQQWDDDGRAFLRGLVAGAPDLQAEGFKGSCTRVQERLVLRVLAEVERDTDCGPIYDTCVVDSWCAYNMKSAVPALQSEYARPSFEENLCSTEWSTTFQRLYECVDRKRDGASGWTRAACAAPDLLTPTQCALILEGFEDGSTHPACAEPAGGWTLAAVNAQPPNNYICTEECANMLSTVWKDCQTSWFHLVMSNTNGWDETGREVLRAMISDDPEYPGSCAKTRRDTVRNTFDTIRSDVVCGPKYWRCMADYNCRVELNEAIGSSLTPWSRTRYESDMCSRTWQMQELYQCYRGMVSSGPLAWKRDRCLIPDKALPPVCTQAFAQVQSNCPDIDSLTVESAKGTSCSESCARSVVTAWSWCQTSYARLLADQPEERRAVIWTLISPDRDEPGPCTATFRDLVSASMRSLSTGPCRYAYNNCVGGQDRQTCLPELREAIGALSTRSENARTIFESTLCQKSISFQWLYTCARHADATVSYADAWSPSACAPADVLSPVQCGSLVSSFRDGTACPVPRSGLWTAESARGYECPMSCAGSLMTAFYECPASFARLIDQGSAAAEDNGRQFRLALFTLVQGWNDPSSEQRGPCTETLSAAIGAGLDLVRDDTECGPLFAACFNDLTCRRHIQDAIRSGFNVHARRAFRTNVCSKPRAFQELYQCMASMDWGASVPDGYTPWTRLQCVPPDKLESSDCSVLLSQVKPSCPGTSFLNAASAERYTCSVECAKSLVTVMSQCHTTVAQQAIDHWYVC